MALPEDLHTAYAKLGEARGALQAASDAIDPKGTPPLGTGEDKYELRLMSDEALDIADRLLLKMQHLNVPLPTG